MLFEVFIKLRIMFFISIPFPMEVDQSFTKSQLKRPNITWKHILDFVTYDYNLFFIYMAKIYLLFL